MSRDGCIMDHVVLVLFLFFCNLAMAVDRIQKQKPGPDGKLPYTGSVQCAMKVVATEGPLAFYKGFFTFYVRIAPHAMITLLCVETLRELFGDASK